MPTQRFLKLKEEKKQAILEAAVHEEYPILLHPLTRSSRKPISPGEAFIHILRIRMTLCSICCVGSGRVARQRCSGP